MMTSQPHLKCDDHSASSGLKRSRRSCGDVTASSESVKRKIPIEEEAVFDGELFPKETCMQKTTFTKKLLIGDDICSVVVDNHEVRVMPDGSRQIS